MTTLNATTKVADRKGALRVLDVLDALSELSRPAALSELAQRLQLPKSTTHRLLTILREAQYVRQDLETERYELGVKALRLGVVALRSHSLLQVAYPRIERLAKQTGETVQIAVIDDDRDLILHRVESDIHAVRAALPAGVRAPIYATAAGKVLLAGLPEAELDALLERIELVRLTPNTITDRAALRREIEGIRAQGYSNDRSENNLEVCCVAVPIRDLRQRVIASLSITAPAARLPLIRAPELASLARATADEISLHLSANPKF